ncbi:MAG TPA: phosphoribosyltransferase family protein [Gammaproteobacteria bacterium]|nr:phosphoribosyltransferase family protein [Gammaproteobacteria bacterium]
MASYHDELALRDRAPVFADRADAGRHLAGMLNDFRGSHALVAAIPAGGVPVAVEIAAGLGLELEVLPVSKILLPWNTESGFGAVAFDGSAWVSQAAVQRFGISPDAVERSTAQARSKVEHRLTLLRGDRPLPKLAGRTVLIVDDGIAAGSTMRVAVAALRQLGAEKVVVAVPTGHASSVAAIAELADETWCANVRGGSSFAVADAYEHWYDLSDGEIAELLEGSARIGS